MALQNYKTISVSYPGDNSIIVPNFVSPWNVFAILNLCFTMLQNLSGFYSDSNILSSRSSVNLFK